MLYHDFRNVDNRLLIEMIQNLILCSVFVLLLFICQNLFFDLFLPLVQRIEFAALLGQIIIDRRKFLFLYLMYFAI